MNTIHNVLCRSTWWRRVVGERLLPWALRGVDLGGEVLEIGPGFGATTRQLARLVPALTAVEIDPRLVGRLRQELGPGVRIVEGDGSDLPFPDGAFTGVVCFTMLHHVPSARRQDMLFAQARRVLAPGGTFAGSDSTPSWWFRFLHLGDTMVALDPATLADRLAAAGFVDIAVSAAGRSLRFRATAP
ncbi:class I SAM-dependent methyltransferase [Pseudonocardia humida]|uniref:Class I SAM-dependent methyltransferase n=1 Tax=Pseudonocardia humida TaxID=2800819 RepID=A0ABT1A4P5_9PSEU|nr:class I SAM-dependent methyltransferase [Pseudonocardia humida]MCO1657809.1 class I SAM-dependent methyltransferase [Pseudonocardia humida]